MTRYFFLFESKEETEKVVKAYRKAVAPTLFNSKGTAYAIADGWTVPSFRYIPSEDRGVIIWDEHNEPVTIIGRDVEEDSSVTPGANQIEPRMFLTAWSKVTGRPVTDLKWAVADMCKDGKRMTVYDPCSILTTDRRDDLSTIDLTGYNGPVSKLLVSAYCNDMAAAGKDPESITLFKAFLTGEREVSYDIDVPVSVKKTEDEFKPEEYLVYRESELVPDFENSVLYRTLFPTAPVVEVKGLPLNIAIQKYFEFWAQAEADAAEAERKHAFEMALEAMKGHEPDIVDEFDGDWEAYVECMRDGFSEI